MIIIYSKFNNLEPEKRERIINAALKEFARSGYERASTNEIIKDAEISKGSLFNYFNSKKDMYLFLFEYVSEVIDKIYDEVDFNKTDFFERMRDVGLIKYKIMKKFPQAFDFLKSVPNEDSTEVKSEIVKIKKNIIGSGLDRGYKNIDFTKFRDDIDIQKTMDIINWAILGFAEKQASGLKSYGDASMELFEEWEEYFAIMKRCFYKKEGD